MNTPYSPDLTRLAAAHADGPLTPQRVARDITASGGGRRYPATQMSTQ